MKRLLLGGMLLVLALSACGGSGRPPVNAPVVTVRLHKLPAPIAKRIAASTPGLRLGVTVPRGLGRYDIRGGGHVAGRRPTVIGVFATDDPPAHRWGQSWPKWSRPTSNGPPANKVAFQISQWLPGRTTLLPTSALRLHLPLSLHQPWFRERLTNGHDAYRWGYLRVHGQIYEAFFWSGRAAPTKDRAAVLSALASVHPRR
jgi:hypothetical protein